MKHLFIFLSLLMLSGCVHSMAKSSHEEGKGCIRKPIEGNHF